MLDNYELMDCYRRESGRVLLTGTQALVRISMMQRTMDVAAGLNTAGFISGYRGSPLRMLDLERAANDVRDHVSRAQSNLPPDVEPPIVSKADADAMPIVGVSVRSDSRNLLELSRIAQESFVERLQTIPSVASAGSRRGTSAAETTERPGGIAGFRALCTRPARSGFSSPSTSNNTSSTSSSPMQPTASGIAIVIRGWGLKPCV